MHNTYSLAEDKMAGGEHTPPKTIKHIITRKVHGGHIHTHVHNHPAHADEDHVTQGTDDMVSHMLEHASEPNPGEAEADAGQSGIGAGAPATPPTGAAPAMMAGAGA